MSCDIKLDNYQGRYYAGDVIVGKVICSFFKREDIRGIAVKLKGKEKNDWVETAGNNTQRHRGRNTFLCVVNNLQNGGTVGPGKFQYPFTFRLPSDIPSTYRGHYGGVSFYVKVEVDRPLAADYTDKKEIVVFSSINFNLIKEKLQLKPVDYSVDKTLCTLCCDSGTLTMDIHLSKTAFAVGEAVNVKIDISNMSSLCVTNVGVELGMLIKAMVSFMGVVGSKYNYELFASDRELGVGPHREKKYSFTLKIPQSTQVPNFNLCKLFNQRTILKVTATLEGFFRNKMVMEVDLTLGHIPVDNPFASGSTRNPIGDLNGSTLLERADGPSAPPSVGGASAPFGRTLSEYEFGVGGEEPPSYNDVMSREGRRTHYL